MNKEKQKQVKQKSKQKQKKEEQTLGNKVLSHLYLAFVGNGALDPVINRSIVSNTYCQIAQLIHIIVLYAIFSSTNNAIFQVLQVVFSGLIIIVCFFPRGSKKHFVLLITAILFILIAVAATVCLYLLISKYISVTTHLAILHLPFTAIPSQIMPLTNLISLLMLRIFALQQQDQSVVFTMRLIYFILIIKAYKASKLIFDSDDQRKRRKEKYAEYLIKKHTYNKDRKV